MELQNKVYEYDELQKTLKTLETYKEGVLSSIREISATQDTLKELKKMKKENEILFPLGAGIFSFGKINNSSEVLLNIGANTITKKSVETAEILLEKRKKEQEEILTNIENQIQENYSKFQKIVGEIQKIQQKKD